MCVSFLVHLFFEQVDLVGRLHEEDLLHGTDVERYLRNVEEEDSDEGLEQGVDAGDVTEELHDAVDGSDVVFSLVVESEDVLENRVRNLWIWESLVCHDVKDAIVSPING